MQDCNVCILSILKNTKSIRRKKLRHFYINDELNDSGAHCSFEGSSGSAAAVAVELLEVEPSSQNSQNCAKTPQEEAISGEAIVSARTVRKRRIAGIFQHYYPEGGWGWVILLCGFLVQVLAVGLQQSLAILIFPLSSRRYQVADNGYIGKK